MPFSADCKCMPFDAFQPICSNHRINSCINTINILLAFVFKQTQHMNCHQQNLPGSIHPVKSAAFVIFLSAVDVVEVLIAGCCETAVFPQLTSDTLEAQRYLWGIDSAKLLSIFFPTFLFTFFFFLMCRWKRHDWPFQAFFSWNTACRRSHWLECGGEEYSMSNRQQVEGWQRWRWLMRKMGRHQRWPASVGIVWLFAATSHLALEAQTTFSGNPAEVLLNVYTKMVWPISTTPTKALTHTTRHTLSTIWLIADDLRREGPGLVWFHAACSCEAAKFSKMPSETDRCREMTIQLRGNSSGGCSCCQHADCTLPPCHTRSIVLCLVAWAAWGTPVQ